MDILGSLMGSAKQMAQSVILDKLDGRSIMQNHPLLTMLHDAFAELPEDKRKELFVVFEKLFEQYKAQSEFDFEVLWQEIIKQPIVQEMAMRVSKKLIGGFMHKESASS